MRIQTEHTIYEIKISSFFPLNDAGEKLKWSLYIRCVLKYPLLVVCNLPKQSYQASLFMSLANFQNKNEDVF